MQAGRRASGDSNMRALLAAISGFLLIDVAAGCNGNNCRSRSTGYYYYSCGYRPLGFCFSYRSPCDDSCCCYRRRLPPPPPPPTRRPTRRPPPPPTRSPTRYPTRMPTAPTPPTSAPTRTPTFAPTCPLESPQNLTDAFCNGRGTPLCGVCRCNSYVDRDNNRKSYTGERCESCDDPFMRTGTVDGRGRDCLRLNLVMARGDEDDRMRIFFIAGACVFVCLLICAFCALYEGVDDDEIEWSEARPRLIMFTVHTLDWLTDVAFVAISLQSRRFQELHAGDDDQVFHAGIGIVTLTSLLWCGVTGCVSAPSPSASSSVPSLWQLLTTPCISGTL